MERYVSAEDLQDAIEAREARERKQQEKGAKQLAEILDAPQSGMSKSFTFSLSPSEDEHGDPDQ
jgi:hypothetical protein